MKLEDNICPICLYIFIQPVSMPCKHELCLNCFEENVHQANFCCPMCRTRISTWARRAVKNKCLVNEKRWSEIKAAFPGHVRKRLEGLEEEDEEMKALNVSIRLAEPGEIKHEYEEQLRKLREQRVEERRQEQAASEQLIHQLQREEEAKRAELEQIQKHDEELARRLSQADGEVEIVTRASSTSDSRSNSTSLEILLDKLRNEDSSSLSPFMGASGSGPGLAVNGGGMTGICTEQQLRKKIRHDENLITTQDIEALEETFKKNTPILDHSISCTLKDQMPPVVQSANILHRKEILEQMSDNICISLYDDESNQSTSATIAKPVLPTEVPFTSNLATTTKATTSTSTSPPPPLDRPHSTDSISFELNHFKPISSCPLTPPRRLPSGKVVEPILIKTTPRKLSLSGPRSPSEDDTLAEIDAGSPIMRRRLSELAEERQDKVEKMSKSTCTGSAAVGSMSARHSVNKQGYHLDIPSNTPSPSLFYRNINLKDISNATVPKSKNVLSEDAGSVKKKLIIPLEPDFTENELFIDTVDLTTPVVETEKLSRNSGRLSRKRKKGKVKEEQAPQCSLMKWVKTGDVVSVNQMGDHHDDSVQALHGDQAHMQKNSHLNHPALSTKSEVCITHTGDHGYRNFEKVGDRPATRPKSSFEKVLVDSDGLSSDSDGDVECDYRPIKKRRLACTSSSAAQCENDLLVKPVDKILHPNSTNSVTGRHKKAGQRNSKSTRRKVKDTHKKTATRTLHEFYRQKSEDLDSNVSQEERDRKMAQKLQKQFELEAKFNLNAIRFKGTTEQYSLRSSRKSTTLSGYS